eukprot:2458935-Rhodomonas_salina.1
MRVGREPEPTAHKTAHRLTKGDAALSTSFRVPPESGMPAVRARRCMARLGAGCLQNTAGPRPQNKERGAASQCHSWPRSCPPGNLCQSWVSHSGLDKRTGCQPRQACGEPGSGMSLMRVERERSSTCQHIGGVARFRYDPLQDQGVRSKNRNSENLQALRGGGTTKI